MSATIERYDLVLKGGRVIDSANGFDGQADVALANGRIAAVARPYGLLGMTNFFSSSS